MSVYNASRNPENEAAALHPTMSTTIKPTAQQLLTRALWLAFQASSAMGMGLFHSAAADAMTEDKLAASYGDDAKAGRIYTDYVCGRMMKTTFEAKDGKLAIRPEVPRHDYQSWAGTYSTAAELVAATEQSFETTA